MPTLCNLETVKHLTGIATVDTVNDGVLLGILEGVEKEFIGQCGWNIATGSYTEIFSGNGKETTTFGVRPVTAIASLSTQNSFAADTWTAINADHYKLRSSRGRYWIAYPSGFTEGTEYRAVYTAGYAATAIPEDIQRLLAVWTVIEWVQLEPSGKRLLPHQVSRAMSEQGVSMSEGFAKPLAWWDRIVKRYRIIPL